MSRKHKRGRRKSRPRMLTQKGQKPTIKGADVRGPRCAGRANYVIQWRTNSGGWTNLTKIFADANHAWKCYEQHMQGKLWSDFGRFRLFHVERRLPVVWPHRDYVLVPPKVAPKVDVLRWSDKRTITLPKAASVPPGTQYVIRNNTSSRVVISSGSQWLNAAGYPA